MKVEERWLRVSEAAKELHVSRATVNRWRMKRIIVGILMASGKEWRYTESEVARVKMLMQPQRKTSLREL